MLEVEAQKKQTVYATVSEKEKKNTPGKLPKLFVKQVKDNPTSLYSKHMYKPSGSVFTLTEPTSIII